MNPKQRFIAALRCREVDRVPVVPKIWVDYAARYTHTDLKQIIQDPLCANYTIAMAGKKLGFDAVRLFAFPEKKIKEENGEVFELDSRGKKIGRIDTQGGLSTYLFDDSCYRIEDPLTISYCHSWTTSSPLVNTIDQARRIAVPDAKVFDHLNWGVNYKKVYEKFGEDLYLIGNLDTATMSFYVTFRGINNAMTDIIINPGLVHAVMQKGTEIAISRGKYWLDQGIEVLRLNDSTGNMSLISPEHWKEFIFPYIKQVCGELHNYNENALIYCHVCGNVLPVIELLVETGLDCIGPLDPLGNFTVKEARAKAGDSVSLMGGVNTLTLLNGTPTQVKQEARQCILGAGKQGYILGSGCVVPRNCPAENLRALAEVAKEL